MARRLLDHLPVFASLTEAERVALVPRMIRDTVKGGAILLEEAAVAPALFILTAGVLVASKRQRGADVEMLRLAPGECFGQTSASPDARAFFKVRALTRATLYRIARADLTPLLLAKPALGAELEQAAARRAGEASAFLPRDGRKTTAAGAGSRLAGRLKAMLGFDRPGPAAKPEPQLLASHDPELS